MSTGTNQVTGIALTIGVNRVGPWYQGGAPLLSGCVNDANAIAKIASSQGFQTSSLTDGRATVAAVTGAMQTAAGRLNPGDIFLIHFSGHGMPSAPDGSTTDAQGFRSTSWCLFDEPLLNHDLYDLWFKFADSVRIAVFSDSCHSGSAVRAVGGALPREIPPAGLQLINNAHPGFFPALAARDAAPRTDMPAAAVILLSGCQNNETSGDAPTNGLFTDAVLKTWNNGTFAGDYRTFYNAAAAATKASSGGTQNPNFFEVGNPLATSEFVQDRPFTVD